MSYSEFAQYYDLLTENVDYTHMADFILNLLKNHGCKPKSILDIACGTGSLALELSSRGHCIIGVDSSAEMLEVARVKLEKSGGSFTLINQDITRLSINQRVDCAISTLDSLNHLASIGDFKKTVARVGEAVNSGGYFLFDLNTPYKHREILGDNAYTFDLGHLFCAWQNIYKPKDDSVEIFLDFFTEQPDGLFLREQEHFYEIIIPHDIVIDTLKKNGFKLIEYLGDYINAPSTATEQRSIYLAKKENL